MIIKNGLVWEESGSFRKKELVVDTTTHRIGHHRPGGLHAADDPGHHPAHRRLLRLHAGSGGRPQGAGHGLLGADHGNADLLSRAGLLRNDMEDVWRGLSLWGDGGAG